MTSTRDSAPVTEEAWYAVVLLFVSEIADIPHLRPLCEQRVVLFRGISNEAVRTQAMGYGATEEHSYRNGQGQLVRWRFEMIERIDCLEPPVDGKGWEVSSRFARLSLAKIGRIKSVVR